MQAASLLVYRIIDGPKEGYRWDSKLQDTRKKGKAPAERDEDGKEINPHIPKYIAQAPCTAATRFPLSY